MKLDILAFGAHPDDVELFAGGTLAKMAANGYATGIVDLTRGELGSRGTPARRAREAKEAAGHLGLRVRENLRLADGDLSITPKARLKVIRVLRKYRPPVVLVHHWEDRHPDHVHASRLVTEASHHAGLAKLDTGQKRFRPSRILYFKLPATQLPSFLVDVSEFREQRTAAILAYGSQLFDPAGKGPRTYLSRPGFLDLVESIHRYYGSMIGKPLAEAFYMKETLEIADPVALFREAEYSGIY